MPEVDNIQQDNTQQLDASAAPTQDQINNQIGMAIAFDDASLMPKTSDNTGITNNNDTGTNGNIQSGDTIISNTPDYTPFIKETFGVDSIEAAKTQWQELQALKANPPKPADIPFADEQSKKIYELLRGGNTKEVINFYVQQERIDNLLTSEVTNNSAEDIIKLGLKLEFPDLTDTEINHTYKKQYSIPKEPVQRTEENDEDFEVRKADYKEQVSDIEMNKIIEAKKSKPKLASAKSKIQLPDIQPTAVTVNEDFEAYKASNAKADEDYNTVTVPGIMALKGSDVTLGFKVEDSNNQMNFDIAIIPTNEDFEKARQDSLSLSQFLSKTCYDKDGKFLPQQLQRMILLTQNFDNYAQSIARQAVNEERKRVISKETNNNGNGSRDYNTNVDMTELQKAMNFALS